MPHAITHSSSTTSGCSSRVDEALKRVEAGVPVGAETARATERHLGPGWQDVIAVRDLRARGMRLVARTSILYAREGTGRAVPLVARIRPPVAYPGWVYLGAR